MNRTIIGALGIAAALTVTMAPVAAASATGRIDQAAKVTDSTIKDRIEYRLEIDEVLKKYDIKVKVDKGQVWLTGDVATMPQKNEAGRLAKVDGATTIANDLRVTPDADATVAERTKKGLNKAGDAITDAWITTKVHWFFMGEDLLKGSEINVDTVNHVVTLKGSVKSKAAQDRAVWLAKQPDGVKSVVDQLTIIK